MNIIITMAGLASRFAKDGIYTPKPLIEISGKTLIEYSVETLNIHGKYIFITRKFTDPEDNIKLSLLLKKIKRDCIEICLEHPTSGAVATAIAAKNYINNNDPLIITNCDQYLNWNSSLFVNFIQNSEMDGCLVTHESTDSRHSYALLNDKKEVVSVKEKEPISHHALVGVHYWRKGVDFINSAELLLKNYQEKALECYMSETYNYLSKDKKVTVFHLSENQYIPLGTPSDISVFNGKLKEFLISKPKTIFCDIDGTILKHMHKISDVLMGEAQLLNGVIDKFNKWDSEGHKIILCTARKESARKKTIDELARLGVSYDYLLMGLTSGERILINDKLVPESKDRAIAINVITNRHFNDVQWDKIDL